MSKWGFDTDALIEAAKGGPELDPSTVSRIAHSGRDISKMRNLAAGIQAYGNANKFRAQLEDQDEAVQARLWRRSNASGRRVLMGVGYRPPTDRDAQRHSKRGPADRINWEKVAEKNKGHNVVAGALGKAADFLTPEPIEKAAGFIEHTVEKEVSRELHNLGAPLRASQHVFRTARMIDEQNFMDGRGGFTLHGAFSPETWARAWDETSHGEKTFSPIQEKKAREKWGDNLVELAKLRASGITDQEFVMMFPEDRRLEVVQRLHDDMDLQEATDWMEASHLSLGRIIVPPSLATSNHKIKFRIPTPWDPMGTKVTMRGSDLHRIVSGGIDAVYDWYADPLVGASKLAKGVQTSRFAIKTLTESGEELGNAAKVVKHLRAGGQVRLDASDVARLAAKPAVRRDLDMVASYIARGEKGVGDLIAEQPRWKNVAGQLFKEKVTTGDKMVEWLQGQAGMSALLEGHLAGMHSHEIVMPFQTTVGERINWFKTGTRRALNEMAEHGPGPTKTAGRLTQAMLNTVPKGGRISAYGRDSHNQFLAEARMALPEARARELTGMWVAAEGEGQKLKVLRGLMDEMRQRSGMSPHHPWWKNTMASFEGVGQVYSDGIREMIDGQAFGFLASQRSTGWHLPSYREWIKATHKGSMFGGTVDAMDKMMDVWRPSVLLRPAFALRAGGEELVGAMMRYGPRHMIQSRLATSAAKDAVIPFSPYHPIRRMFERVTKGWDPELAYKVQTPAEFVGLHFGLRARRAFRHVEGRLAGDEYLNAAWDMAHHPEVRASAGREIFASEQRDAGFGNPDMIRRMVVRNGRVTQAFFDTTGKFANLGKGTSQYDFAWQSAMQELAGDQIGKKALELFDLPHDQQIQQLADYIGSPELARLRSQMVRSRKLPDGREVGVDATPREALESWADVVVGHMDDLLRSENGQPLSRFVERLRADDVPSLDDIVDLPVELKPFSVKGPELVEVSRHFIRDLTDKGFNNVVGRPMDWMIREPLFLHHYAVARKRGEFLRQFGFNDDAIREWSMLKATDDVIPYIHDPRLRSHFSVHIRNLAPFWFAQEQFYKRVARSVALNPAALRQTQLVMGGIRHTGFIHKGEDGEDYFMMPGADVVNDVMAVGVGLLFGADAPKIAMPFGFSGKVHMASPGTERLGLPSLGPLVGIGLKAMAKVFPELEPMREGLMGEIGLDRGYWEMIVPSTISRLIHASTDDENNSVQYASAMMQTMQYLEAAGKSPGPDASAHDIEVYKDRVRNLTRAMFFTRAVFGFGAPASPSLELDPKNFNKELHDLMSIEGVSYQEAVGEFIYRHPDADSYTVFPTSSVSGAPLASTKKALKFMEDNRTLLEEYPKAGGWLLPAPNRREKFEGLAYREQLALGLRRRKAPDEFYDDLKFHEAAGEYFDRRDAKEQALLENKGNKAQTKAIAEEWRVWKDAYLNEHRVFAERLNTDASGTRRAEVMRELHEVLADHRTPKTPQVKQLKIMLEVFDEHVKMRDSLIGRRDTLAKYEKERMTAEFAAWASAYVERHPVLDGFYNGVIRPEVDIHG